MIRDGVIDIREGVVGATVERFAADGTGGQQLGAGALESASSLAFDSDLGNLIVVSDRGPLTYVPLALNVYHDELLVEKFPLPPQTISSTLGELASDGGSSGRLYVLAKSVGTPPSIQVLSPIAVPTLDPLSGAKGIGGGQITVHLSGTVNPLGRLAKYRFEYSSDGGSSWTAMPEGDAGSGTSPVPVEIDPVLPGDTSYQVRLVISSYGTSKASPPMVLPFLSTPSLATARADHLSPGAAMLHGLVQPVGATSYRFEYGTSAAYGSQMPVGSAGDGKTLLAVSQTVSGLRPATAYHFRLVVENSVGPRVGEDKTFTTPPVARTASARRGALVGPAPAAAEGATRHCGKGSRLSKVKGRARCVRPHRKHKKRKHRRLG